MTKVVEFPKHKIVREAPVNSELLEKAQLRSLQNHADTIVEDLISNIAEELENEGIDIDNNQFLKDFSLTVDALRATVYRNFGLEHPLHSFIDENIRMIDRKTGELLEVPEEEETIDTTKI